jgi:hypothetical protein
MLKRNQSESSMLQIKLAKLAAYEKAMLTSSP